MAVTRREFVTTLGLLAGAMGMGSSELAKVVEAFGGPYPNGTVFHGKKPKVLWVHGAECTGCSTSLLSLFEDATGQALPDLGIATSTALVAAATGTLDTDAGHAAGTLASAGFRTLQTHVANLNVDAAGGPGGARAINIADVLIDFIDLQYHETLMAAGGDLAYAFLNNEMYGNDTTPFVLVVEGAVQDKAKGGYWGKSTGTPWCSIGMRGDGVNDELSFDDVVEKLATKSACKAVIAIGQCATFGGYPAATGSALEPNGNTKNQTGAQGVYAFLAGKPGGAQAKVVNVPGCPTNPWWFILTVVAWLVDVATGPGHMKESPVGSGTYVADPKPGYLGILGADFSIVGGVDTQRRLLGVYGHLLHGKYCPRYPFYAARVFATKPGEAGCLKNIGCKGLSTMSLCGRHGWNAQQPQNAGLQPAVEDLAYKAPDGVEKLGGFCMTAGAPCMGCTEKGYPDAFVPFVNR